VAAAIGVGLLSVSTLLHPSSADPNEASAAFAEYAMDSLWVWSHLGQFLGFAFLVLALVALARTLVGDRGAFFARAGLVGVTASLAVAAALQAVDGIALKRMVDRWAATTGDARAITFEATFAVRQVEIGLAAFLSVVSGLAVTAFGLAVIGDRRYPLWFGLFGIVSGVLTVVAGAIQAATGFSPSAMTASGAGTSIVLLWVLAAAVLMWRRAPTEP